MYNNSFRSIFLLFNFSFIYGLEQAEMIKTIISNYNELKKISVAVEKNEDVSQIIADLRDTLDPTRGFALAANQIGILKRIFFFKIAKKIDPKTKEVEYEELVVINPEIIEKE